MEPAFLSPKIRSLHSKTYVPTSSPTIRFRDLKVTKSPQVASAPLPALHQDLAGLSLLEGLSGQGAQQFQEHQESQGGLGLPETEKAKGEEVTVGSLPKISARIPSSLTAKSHPSAAPGLVMGC